MSEKPTYPGVITDIERLGIEHQNTERALARTTEALEQTKKALAECEAGTQPPVIPPVLPPDPPVIPPDPPTKPPTKPPTDPTMPWPHAMVRMTVEQAADACEARVRPILDAAPARTDMGFDVVYDQLEDAGINHDGFIVNEGRHGRWGKAYGSPRHYDANGDLIPRRVGLKMDNCEMLSAWDDQSSGSKWHVRMSNVPSVLVTRMQCVGHDVKGRNYPKEHGLYVDVSGDVTVADSLFKNIGGHPLYFPSRAYDFQQYGFISLPFTEPPTYTFDNVIGIHCEQDASRSAFDLTLYDAGNYAHPGEVVVKDCAFVQAWETDEVGPYQRSQGTNERHPVDPYRQGETRASGGVMLTNYDPANMQDPILQTHYNEWCTERFVATRCLFRTEQARHSLLSLHNVQHILLKDSTFQSEGKNANKVISIGRKERLTEEGLRVMAAPQTIVVQNCIAPGMVLEVTDDDKKVYTHDMNCPGKVITWTSEHGFVASPL